MGSRVDDGTPSNIMKYNGTNLKERTLNLFTIKLNTFQ